VEARIFDLLLSVALPYTLGMPTTKAETTKDARLEIRLTAEDKELLTAAADADGRSLSNWIRFTLLRAAGDQLGRKRKR